MNKNKWMYLAMGVFVAVILAFVIYASIGSKQTKTDLNIPNTVLTGSTVNTSDKRLKALSAQINRMYSENSYTSLSIGEDVYLTMIYNKNKQAYAESQYGGAGLYVTPYECITRTGDENGNAVFQKTSDITALATAESMMDLAVKGKAIVQDVKMDEISGTEIASASNANSKAEVVFKIVVMGDNIKGIFAPMGSKEADDMVKNIFGESIDPNNAMSLLVAINTDNNQLGLGLSTMMDGTEYINWYMDGSIPLKDWSIPEDLSKFDYSSLSDSDKEQISKEYDSIVEQLGSHIQSYMSDNKEMFDYIKGEESGAATTESGATTSEGNTNGESETSALSDSTVANESKADVDSTEISTKSDDNVIENEESTLGDKGSNVSIDESTSSSNTKSSEASK